MRDCTKCPFLGLKDNKKECAVWGCTRSYCISDYETGGADYEELAKSFGFETYQDMCEVMYKMKF